MKHLVVLMQISSMRFLLCRGTSTSLITQVTLDGKSELCLSRMNVPLYTVLFPNIFPLCPSRHERFEKVIVDSSLYMDKNTELFPATETRQMPEAFKIFTGVCNCANMFLAQASI
jgi:hypothetical protein